MPSDVLKTIPEAARELGLSRVVLWRICDKLGLGLVLGGRRHLSRDDIKRIKRTPRRKAGRPKAVAKKGE